jgi:hypothetical protein
MKEALLSNKDVKCDIKYHVNNWQDLPVKIGQESKYKNKTDKHSPPCEIGAGDTHL